MQWRAMQPAEMAEKIYGLPCAYSTAKPGSIWLWLRSLYWLASGSSMQKRI